MLVSSELAYRGLAWGVQQRVHLPAQVAVR
jgi:hypothetical protein